MLRVTLKLSPMRFQLVMIEVNHLLAIALLFVVAVAMFLRKLHRQVPVFFAYILYALLFDVLHYGLVHLANPNWAWYSTWADDVFCILLEVAIFAEIFNRLFAPYSSIRQFAKLVVFWSAATLVVIGTFTAVFFHQVAYSVPVLTIFLVLDRTLRAVQLGLILTLFALSKYLHLRWKHLIFGIALGFGFYALMILTGDTVRMYYGQLVAGNVGALEGAAYCAAVLIWVVYTLQPEVARIPIVSLPSNELERWDRALAQLLRRSTSSSIPPASA